jgi:hypothetical protein
MPSTCPGTPHAAVVRIGSPNEACSTLITSAPQSDRMAAAEGTNAYNATSTTLIPFITLVIAIPPVGVQ